MNLSHKFSCALVKNCRLDMTVVGMTSGHVLELGILTSTMGHEHCKFVDNRRIDCSELLCTVKLGE